MCETSVRLDGKVAIVTGGSSGIGLETAKDLAYRGARVILASRNETRMKEARDEIFETTGNADVECRRLDLASLKSIREFASETVHFEKRLDILINNIGAIGLPDKLTEDGLNLTLQVNYFGAFLLTYLLLPFLKASAPSRIVTSTGATMNIGQIDFDHWNDVGRNDWITPLATSKLADNLFTAELSRRLKGTGVSAYTFDPFLVRDTDLLKNAPRLFQNISRIVFNTLGQSKEVVGKQQSYLAVAPGLEKDSGGNFKFCQRWTNHYLVNDEQLTKKLWEKSKEAVKITDFEDWEGETVNN